jgi:membrane protein required for colicin V production
MNWLDWVFLVLVAGSATSAFIKGVSREFIGLVSVIAGVVLGTWFYGTVSFYLVPYVKARSLANLLAFLILFGGIMLLGSAIGRIVRGLAKASGLSFVDRLLGAAFGFVRGIVICVAVLMAAAAFTPRVEPPNAIVHSRLSPYFMRAASVGASMAPYELREGFRNTYDQVKAAWRSAVNRGIHELPGEKTQEEKR